METSCILSVEILFFKSINAANTTFWMVFILFFLMVVQLLSESSFSYLWVDQQEEIENLQHNLWLSDYSSGPRSSFGLWQEFFWQKLCSFLYLKVIKFLQDLHLILHHLVFISRLISRFFLLPEVKLKLLQLYWSSATACSTFMLSQIRICPHVPTLIPCHIFENSHTCVIMLCSHITL